MLARCAHIPTSTGKWSRSASRSKKAETGKCSGDEVITLPQKYELENALVVSFLKHRRSLSNWSRCFHLARHKTTSMRWCARSMHITLEKAHAVVNSRNKVKTFSKNINTTTRRRCPFYNVNVAFDKCSRCFLGALKHTTAKC